jgi:hypothetical protein
LDYNLPFIDKTINLLYGGIQIHRFKMKIKERQQARSLRQQGLSLREIAKITNCSKSVVSYWIKDIPLTEKQIEQLKSNQDKGRARAAQHPNSSKQKWEKIRSGIMEKAAKDIPAVLSINELRIIGAALYWAEGYNASRSYFFFANSNPDMIKVMMRFLHECCQVPPEKIKCRVNIHPHLDIVKAEEYWMGISGIPKTNFNKPLLAVSRASKQKRDTLPMGTFNIGICDVALLSQVKGWIKGLISGADSSVG